MAWDVQAHGCPRQNMQGWTKGQGWGQWSSCIPVTVLEISLTAGNGSAKGSQCCPGRSLSWGRGRGEGKVIATQRRMEKKRKMCGRYHSERTWEVSFIVTHTRVISDWTGTDGLEENLCLEGQGKALKDLANRGVRRAQTQLGEGCGLCRQQDVERGGDHSSKRFLGGMGTA